MPRPSNLGNFWVDLVRICLRVLLPVAVVGAVVFVAAGMVQNFRPVPTSTTLAGATQHITGGPVASQEVIKEFGTNGGGFSNANSSHPFENPERWTNWIEIFLLLVIPFSLPRMFGRMVRDNRQGYAIVAVMATLRCSPSSRSTSCSSSTVAPCRRPSGPRRRGPRAGSASRSRRPSRPPPR